MRKNDIMKRTDFQEYWRYYIHLEALLIKTFDFVALTGDNFSRIPINMHLFYN